MAKRIFLCVVGETPQIITETLYFITQKQGERVDEIRVITTLAGRNKIMRELLDKQSGKFFEFCRDFGIDPASIKFDEKAITLLQASDKSMLDDIRSEKDNESAANEICEVVRELTGNADTRIHASAAGGRKTMSVYLTVAMQLFGRNQDRLSHVLVSEDFETNPDFFYKPPTPRFLKTRDGREISTETAEIHLAPIPFIRLRRIISHWLPKDLYSYSDLVARAQEELDLYESLHDLRINLRSRTVTVAKHSVKLPEREFFFYTLFAWLRKENRGKEKDGFVSLDEIERDDLDATFRRITSARGVERGLEDYELVAGFNFIERLLEHLAKDPIAFQETFTQVKARIKRKLEDASLRDRYLIATDGQYGSSRYGLKVAPDRIMFS